jgi:ElaB/YqjD/DUF883 family membrane-anchored ribosome-binding protein
MRGQQDHVAEAADRAQGAIVETAQTVRDAAADMGARASDYAREAGRQVSGAARSAYGSGNDMLDVVEGFARSNVWASLAIAGAVGYGLACLIKNSR